MSTKKSTTPAASFGTPMDELPEARNGGNKGPRPHWLKVAEHVRANPGVWHPVTISTLTAKAHQSAASAINAATRSSESKTGKNIAFTEPGYTAAYREGRLYVRYDAPAVKLAKRSAA